MSNVIHADALYSGADKQAVVGKIYAGALQISEGLGGPVATAEIARPLVAGVAVADIAQDEFGFVVCRGVVEGVKAAAGINIGELLGSTNAAGGGQVDDLSPAAGKSISILGVALTATASSAITAYINVL